MLAALALATLLSVSDPQGDAVGNGDLLLPTAAAFRTSSLFDATGIRVPEGEHFGFQLTMAQLSEGWGQNVFPLPIIEVYLDSETGGQTVLLPGSGMRLSAGAGWNYAFKLTGDTFTVYAPGTDGGDEVNVTAQVGATIHFEGNTIVVQTALPMPRRFSLYGMVGSYDPFTPSGWRPIEREPSPWKLSSSSQTVPVIDVLADSFSLQRDAINSGVLPEIRSSYRQDRWLLVAAGGGVLTFLGLLSLMFTARRARRLPPEPAYAYDYEEEEAEYEPEYGPADDAYDYPPAAYTSEDALPEYASEHDSPIAIYDSPERDPLEEVAVIVGDDTAQEEDDTPVVLTDSSDAWEEENEPEEEPLAPVPEAPEEEPVFYPPPSPPPPPGSYSFSLEDLKPNDFQQDDDELGNWSFWSNKGKSNSDRRRIKVKD